MIRYGRHRRQIERLYKDNATISRKTVDDSGPTSSLVSAVIYSDQACMLSQTGLPRNGQTEAQNDIQYDAKLFIAPELDIKQGDEIVITRKATGRDELYIAGEPFPAYESHQEVLLTKEGRA